MVICVAELTNRIAMTRTTEGRFIGSEHFIFLDLGRKSEAPRVLFLFECLEIGSGIWVNLVAANATYIGLSMLGAIPVTLRESVLMASQTGGRCFFSIHLAERNDFRVLFCRMNFAGTMTTLAATLCIWQIGIGHEHCVGGLIELRKFRLVAFGTSRATGEIVLGCSRKKLICLRKVCGLSIGRNNAVGENGQAEDEEKGLEFDKATVISHDEPSFASGGMQRFRWIHPLLLWP